MKKKATQPPTEGKIKDLRGLDSMSGGRSACGDWGGVFLPSGGGGMVTAKKKNLEKGVYGNHFESQIGWVERREEGLSPGNRFLRQKAKEKELGKIKRSKGAERKSPDAPMKNFAP